MTKSTLCWKLPSSSFARLLRRRPFIIRDIFYLIWRNPLTISHLWWSFFFAIYILRSLPIQREFLEFWPFYFFHITHLSNCLNILACIWLTNSGRVKSTWKKKSRPSRSSANGSPPVFVTGFHGLKSYSWPCIGTDICSFFTALFKLAVENKCCDPSQFLFIRRFFLFSEN